MTLDLRCAQDNPVAYLSECIEATRDRASAHAIPHAELVALRDAVAERLTDADQHVCPPTPWDENTRTGVWVAAPVGDRTVITPFAIGTQPWEADHHNRALDGASRLHQRILRALLEEASAELDDAEVRDA